MSGFQVTDVQHAFKNFSYPGSPDELARHAESNGANSALVEALEGLGAKSLGAPTDVMHELSQQDALGGETPGGHQDRSPKDVEGPAWQVTDVQSALKGAKYPSSGKDLAGVARSNKADKELVDAVESLDRTTS